MMVQTEHVANIFGVRFLPGSDNRRAHAPSCAGDSSAINTSAMRAIAKVLHLA